MSRLYANGPAVKHLDLVRSAGAAALAQMLARPCKVPV